MHATATTSRPLVPLNRSLVLTAVLAGLIVAATFWLVARNQSDAAWVVHSLAARDELTNVLSRAEAAETGQRGYLLTGREDYLAPYNQAIKELPDLLIILPISPAIIRVSNRRSRNCDSLSKANSTSSNLRSWPVRQAITKQQWRSSTTISAFG